MAYQVLALKYRPLLFDEIVGQEHITKTLSRAVATGRLANGYLFTGPRGTGKTTTARVLAKALNCIEGPTPTPCNKCPMCKEIIAGSSLDVLEIDAASNTSVDDVRTLRENIRYLPTSGKKRVFIIDEVHRLSGSAFDALLKTLEEPPEHAVFIFATTEPHKVPQTILSRTQRYDFRRVRTADLVTHMKRLAGLEKVEIDDDALYLIARKAEGSVRDALSLFDQMIAVADGKITRELTAQTLGVVDRQIFGKLLEVIAAGNTEPVFGIVRDLFESGADITELVNDFIDCLRNLLILKTVPDPDQLLDIAAAEREDLTRQSSFFTEADILRMIQILSELLSQLKRGYDERIFLEICLVRLARMESSITLQEVIERLNRLSSGAAPAQEQAGTLFSNVKPVARPMPSRHEAAPAVSAPPAQPDAEAEFERGKPLNLPRVQMSWKKYLDSLRKRKAMLASLLAMGQISAVADNRITVMFPPAYVANKQVVEKPESKAIIEEVLREYYQVAARIDFEIDKTQETTPAKKPSPGTQPIAAEDLFKKAPDLKRMVDQIDGEIIARRKVDE